MVADKLVQRSILDPTREWRVSLVKDSVTPGHAGYNEKAARANIESALHVLELARALPRLVSLVSVSTAYATPHPGDRVPVEERLAPLGVPARELYDAILDGRFDAPQDESRLLAETGHPNTYTLTKCIAEHLLAEGRGDLPLRLVRPSIIAASLRQPFAGWLDSAAAGVRNRATAV